MRYCKVCTSQLRDDIDVQIMSGLSFREIEKYCSDRGLEISETSLRRHAFKHIVGYEKPKSYHKKISSKEQSIKKHEPDLLIVDFDVFCSKIGLNPKDLENFDNVITASQKALAIIFFKELSILDTKLNTYLEGKTRHPTDQIRAIKVLFELFYKVYSLENVIDKNVALKTIESIGYIPKNF